MSQKLNEYIKSGWAKARTTSGSGELDLDLPFPFFASLRKSKKTVDFL